MLSRTAIPDALSALSRYARSLQIRPSITRGGKHATLSATRPPNARGPFWCTRRTLAMNLRHPVRWTLPSSARIEFARICIAEPANGRQRAAVIERRPRALNGPADPRHDNNLSLICRGLSGKTLFLARTLCRPGKRFGGSFLGPDAAHDNTGGD